MAGGEEVGLLFDLDLHTVQKLELPAKRWIYAASLGGSAVLVSSDGYLAEVTTDGKAQVRRVEALRRHDVVGAASPDGESLLIASRTGLYQITAQGRGVAGQRPGSGSPEL